MSNDPFQNEQAPTMPAGWYPDQSGQQRYWDGNAWTEHVQPAAPAVPQASGSLVGSPTDAELTMAALAHGLAIISAFLAPLIIMLIKGDRSPYVKYHSIEALNFSITVTIAYVISAVLVIVLIGLLMMPLVWIGAAVLQIMAAMAANRGEYYKYPFSIRLISGPTV